jgi:hypothetical protein
MTRASCSTYGSAGARHEGYDGCKGRREMIRSNSVENGKDGHTVLI